MATSLGCYEDSIRKCPGPDSVVVNGAFCHDQLVTLFLTCRTLKVNLWEVTDHSLTMAAASDLMSIQNWFRMLCQ